MRERVLVVLAVRNGADSLQRTLEAITAQTVTPERVVAVATKVSSALGIPVEFVDERLSSSEAKRYLRDQGFSEKKMRGRIDCIAASLFLQTWLDCHAQRTLGDA